MRYFRWFVFGLAIILIGIFMIISLRQQYQKQTPAINMSVHPNQVNTLIWGTVNPPTIINPVITSHGVSSALLGLIFDSLFVVNEKGEYTPSLVEQWDVSSDELVYTFHLKKNVLFHDGHLLTSHDVVFTYEAIAYLPNNSHWRSNTEMISSWEVINDFTFKIWLKKPFKNLISKLIREILPKRAFVNLLIPVNHAFNSNPIGSGPYQFESWDKNLNRVRLSANKNYFKGKPNIDVIEVRTYRNNQELWSALMRGEVNLIKFISSEQYLSLAKDPNFKVFEVPTRMFFGIAFNFHDWVLSQREVRVALSYAINRQELMAISGYGGPDTVDKEYNPIRAKMLLAANGWEDHDGDGILDKASYKLDIRLLVNDTQEQNMRLVMLLRQQLGEVGIKLTIIPKRSEDELTADFIARYKPQAWLRMFPSPKVAQFEAISVWYSNSTHYGNLWAYKDERLDALYDQIAHTEDNPAIISNAYDEIKQILENDKPFCFLFYPKTFHAVSSRIKGAESFFNPFMPSDALKSWSIN